MFHIYMIEIYMKVSIAGVSHSSSFFNKNKLIDNMVTSESRFS